MARTLLVIDIQYEYFSGGGLPLWQSEDVEARAVSAIGRARAAGDKIVLVRHVSTEPAGLFAADTPGVVIRPAVVAASIGAPIVTKHHPDAFQDTDLATHLAGTNELLICGMMTQNCIVFTALSKASAAYRTRIVGDLCTAPSEIVHLIALNALRSKTDVVTAAEVWP